MFNATMLDLDCKVKAPPSATTILWSSHCTTRDTGAAVGSAPSTDTSNTPQHMGVQIGARCIVRPVFTCRDFSLLSFIHSAACKSFVSSAPIYSSGMLLVILFVYSCNIYYGIFAFAAMLFNTLVWHDAACGVQPGFFSMHFSEHGP